MCAGISRSPDAENRVRRRVEVTSTASGNLEIVIVADDMPLLVEAVLATVLESWALTVDGIDHLVMPVVRDDAGVLTEVGEGHRPSASRGSTCGHWPPRRVSTHPDSATD